MAVVCLLRNVDAKTFLTPIDFHKASVDSWMLYASMTFMNQTNPFHGLITFNQIEKTTDQFPFRSRGWALHI